MNNQQNSLNRIFEVINKSSSGVILVPSKASGDTVAAACSLYLALIKMGKNVSLSSSKKPNYDLVGVDKFQQTLSTDGNSLMISFPYTEGSIDKVDYNIQGDYFNLIITPREGYEKLDPNKVSFSYTGGKIDFFIVIDAPNLNSLGSIYTDNQNLFTGCEIINIDRHLINSYFGTVNYVDKTSSSISELILNVIKTLKIDFDKDISTNLYAGIALSTNNFTSYSTNATTFENVAFLLKQGAIKKILKKPEKEVIERRQISPASPPSLPKSQTLNFSPPEFEPTPIEMVEKEKQPQSSNFEGKKTFKPSSLKPKIFRGGGLVK